MAYNDKEVYNIKHCSEESFIEYVQSISPLPGKLKDVNTLNLIQHFYGIFLLMTCGASNFHHK